MTRSGRKRRLRSSNQTNNADAVVKADATAADESNKVSKKGLKCHYYSTDDDETQTHILDGVEYKNYNDFVEAKRKRNEAYLQTLGFDSHKRTTTNTESGPAEQNTSENKEEAELQDRRIVSPPASSYYERFEMGEMSLDGASLSADPFDQISKLLVKLEEEIIKISKLQKVTKEWTNVEKESKEESKRSILSLLEKVLSHLSLSNKDLSMREKYVEAFQQLEGVECVIRVFQLFSCNHYENLDILGFCLDILRDACCISVGTKSKTSASEKVALAVTKNENDFLKLLIDFVYKTFDVMSHSASKSKSRRKGRSQTRSPEKHSESPEVRRRNTLATMSKVWSVFVNLTYFQSVIDELKGRDHEQDDYKKYEYSILNRLVYMTRSSMAALDDHVTKDLAKILPLPPSLEKKASGKTGLPKKTQTSKSKETAPEAIKKCRSIAMEASRTLEPILGTIRNIIADPSTSSNYWEISGFVSSILDIICKGEEDTVKKPQINSKQSDWLNFVTQSEGNVVPKDPPPPIMFRWMEQSEATVLEILGIFKVCLDKGVLCTYSNDVERLVGFCVRCLRKFGMSSSRTTLRILGLVEGLVTPSWNGVYGLTSAKARLQKRIVHREGFLDELVNLSGRYSSLHGCGSLPSNGERVRSETQSLIALLRVIER